MILLKRKSLYKIDLNKKTNPDIHVVLQSGCFEDMEQGLI